MNGVTAFATSNHQIVLHIAPQKYDEEMLKYALAHEYYHVVYYEEYRNRKRDLVEYVISEGKADSFANILIPNFKAPWTKELSPEGVNTIWNWIKERRYSFNETDSGEMHNGNREISQWSDYRIRYHIMQEFLKNNPNVTLEEWTLMESDKILEKSGFLDK